MKNLITLFAVACLSFFTANAATTITVTQITDDGTGATSGSLSWAINTAAAEGDVIAFNLTAGDVVTLSAALPTIDKSFTMEGINIATGNRVTIQVASPGVSTYRVFTILFSVGGKTITLNDLILRGGNVPTANGGVVNSSAGFLNLNRCVIRDGKASGGGGIYATGTLMIMNQCTVTDNAANGGGGGVYLYGISISSIIINSTITANVATVNGGGVYIASTSKCNIINTTISDNAGSGGGGVYAFNTTGSTLCLALNSIFINNTGGDFGTSKLSFSYGYYSWKNTGTAWKGTNASALNIANSYTAGDLGSLGNNGGATPTMQLSATAPAYQTGGYAYYNATDGYYYKGTNGSYYKLANTVAAFTPVTANPENDKITTDQRGATRDATPSMGAYDGTLAQPMQLKFTTTDDDRGIDLPLFGTVNCTVDWGDGSATETFTTEGTQWHTYATAGTYTVSINGSLTHFGYYNTGNNKGWDGSGYLTEVVDFGSLGLTSLSGAFADADNLSSVPASLPATVTDLSYCFYLNDKASITNLNLWNVSSVTDMTSMFEKASAFNQAIGNWNVSKVTSMNRMFYRAWAFNQPIGNWNVSSVTDLSAMFRAATVFNQPIGNWIVSNATDMSGMFETAEAFNQPIGNWNVGKATSMSSMFDWATSFNQDISDWDVINVTDMSWMFSGATAFDQSLAGWDISSVTTMEDMFADVTLSTANYDAILISWGSNAVESDVVFGAGNSKYSAGAAATARGVLTGAPNSWTITDGGMNVVTYTWDGSESSDWNTAANWDLNAAPTASDNVTIPDVTNDPVVNEASGTPAVCNNLTIQSGAVLTIASGKALTVNGTLTNSAGTAGLMINSGGSLIQNTADVAATVKREIAGVDKYHLFMSPINESVVADGTSCFNGAYVDRYQESAGEWVRLVTGNNVVSDYGYSINFANGTPELIFPGTLKTSPVSYTNLSFTPAAPGYGSGWNLVGNPYTCGINTALLTAPESLNNAAYVWNESAGNYSTITFGSASATPGTIASLQSFFVRTLDGTNLLTLDNAAKAHSGTFVKSSAIAPDMIKLKITGNSYSDETFVRFLAAATAGFDQQYDAYKLSGLDEAPQLYSVLPDEKAAINTLPSFTANQYIPLGLKVGTTATYTIQVEGINSFDPSLPISLDDLKLGSSVDLRLNPDYSFTASPSDAENRFRLSFATVTGRNLPEASGISINAKNGIIRVSCEGTNSGKVYVYSTAGQLLATSILTSGEATLRVASKGVYMVKVVTGKTSLTRKLVVMP